MKYKQPHPYKIARQIKRWDGVDIYELKQRLEELREAASERGMENQEFVDMCSLPLGMEVPREIDHYIIWSIDASGRVLCGDGSHYEVDTVEEMARVCRQNRSSET
ncbi:hypothetical protein [Martelella mediterranea]|uniref:Uncharacterized protein n=1 Tax=Martelella mediterranea TaxID=293089 RepID=A0A4R3NW96_9HYPH|nr:hypothetical protein [Martelella mediterranea]TCT44474.1 hypothetical protein EDC90_100222 [Martelella mediterranea]